MLPSLSVYWYMTCKYCSYYNVTCKNKALYPGMKLVPTIWQAVWCNVWKKPSVQVHFSCLLVPCFFHRANEMGVAKKKILYPPPLPSEGDLTLAEVREMLNASCVYLSIWNVLGKFGEYSRCWCFFIVLLLGSNQLNLFWTADGNNSNTNDEISLIGSHISTICGLVKQWPAPSWPDGLTGGALCQHCRGQESSPIQAFLLLLLT